MAITAQRILDENNWLTTDITLVNCEYLIDNAINYINLETGLSMSNLTGVAGAQTVTLTNPQETAVKMLSALLVRAYLDKGSSVNIQSIGVATIISDPHFRVFQQLLKKSISRLKGRSMMRC